MAIASVAIARNTKHLRRNLTHLYFKSSIIKCTGGAEYTMLMSNKSKLNPAKYSTQNKALLKKVCQFVLLHLEKTSLHTEYELVFLMKIFA